MKTVLSWSGGKDSALSYFATRDSKEIMGLVTTVTHDYQRISMHGVSRELLVRQSEALELPLYEVMIPKGATNAVYEDETKKILFDLRTRYGVTKVIFGDLFLQDIRSYREDFLGRLGFDLEFPLWGKDTNKLARYFIESGFKAVVCCVDPRKIPPELCGREFDEGFLSDLPSEADPCGENGEFHTFVFDGPIFREKIAVTVAEVVERDGFYFADILPA